MRGDPKPPRRLRTKRRPPGYPPHAWHRMRVREFFAINDARHAAKEAQRREREAIRQGKATERHNARVEASVTAAEGRLRAMELHPSRRSVEEARKIAANTDFPARVRARAAALLLAWGAGEMAVDVRRKRKAIEIDNDW